MSRLVVKIGSSLLVEPVRGLRKDWLASLASDVAERRLAGDEVIIVTSGATSSA
jgi:glutamate 5-kinase